MIKVKQYKIELVLILLFGIFNISIPNNQSSLVKTNAYAQATDSDGDGIPQAKEKSINSKEKTPQFKPIPREEIVRIIKEKGAVENNVTENQSLDIKVLEKQFEEAEHEVHKSLYSSILIRLGVEDEKYFNYLNDLAETIIRDHRPFPLKLDDSGNEIRGQASDEFQDWCKEENKEINVCVTEYFRTYPAIISYLGLTDDDKFFDYLKSGLNSSNDSIVIASANGLGILGNEKGIQLIENALENTENKSYQREIALSLFFIDNSYAEELARQYISDERKIEIFKRYSKENRYDRLLPIY
ncbi:MAG: HEAT repeat domain-containing protein [Thermodesulfobacteriota bacterium]